MQRNQRQSEWRSRKVINAITPQGSAHFCHVTCMQRNPSQSECKVLTPQGSAHFCHVIKGGCAAQEEQPEQRPRHHEHEDPEWQPKAQPAKPRKPLSLGIERCELKCERSWGTLEMIRGHSEAFGRMQTRMHAPSPGRRAPDWDLCP